MKNTMENNIENGSKDFHIRVLKDERLITPVQGLDAELEKDMLDIGSLNDLPDSDKIMICQQKGIKERQCTYLEL